MKVVLDLDDLLKQGKISPEQATYFSELSLNQTGSTAINLLVAFGAIGISVGTFALFLNAYVGLLLGALAIVAGFYIVKNHEVKWGLLGGVLNLTGGLFLAASLLILFNGGASTFLLVAILFLILGIATPSKLLVALSPFAISAALGSGTSYSHAMYELSISEPTKTIVIFSLLAFAVYYVGKKVALFESASVIFSRVCILLVNFGFWIGSLWGDTLNKSTDSGYTYYSVPQIPAYAFAIVWAIALVALGVWAARENKRFVFNTVAVFASIHFYTQWFEYLGMQPISVLLGGCILVVIALGLWKLNRESLSK